MKLVKQASGKTTIKMSHQEWTDLGKKAGWMKEAQNFAEQLSDSDLRRLMSRYSYVKNREDAISLLEQAHKKATSCGNLPQGCSIQEVMNLIAPRKKITIDSPPPRKKITIGPEDIPPHN
jgi:hypothetical protein